MNKSKFNILIKTYPSPNQIDNLFKYYKDNRLQAEYVKTTEKNVNRNNKIGIVVPFRIDRDYDFYDDKRYIREEQLDYFIKHFKKFMEGQNYKIYIIEQSNDNQKFNRGKLLNIGIQMAINDRCDIIICHNVSLYPDKNMLPYYTTIPSFPDSIIQTAYVKFHGLDKILSMTPQQFQAINGYPNTFFGKGGGENEALYNRITESFGKILIPADGTIKEWITDSMDDRDYSLQYNSYQKKDILIDLVKWKDNGLNDVNYDLLDTYNYTSNITKYTISMVNWLTLSFNELKAKSKNIYIVNGLRRSGNHLFLGYLISGLPGKCYFLNNMKTWMLNKDTFKYKESESYLFNKDINEHIMDLKRLEVDNDVNIIISLEDKKYKDMLKFEEKLNSKNNKIIKIIVIRDILNTFASRIAKANHNKPVDNMTVDYWMNLYEHSSETITFNYNKFICDKNDYQHKLNKELGLKKPIMAVSHASQGSSFNVGSNKEKNLEQYFTRFIKCKNKILSKLIKDKSIKNILKKDFEIDVKYDGKKVAVCGK